MAHTWKNLTILGVLLFMAGCGLFLFLESEAQALDPLIVTGFILGTFGALTFGFVIGFHTGKGLK